MKLQTGKNEADAKAQLLALTPLISFSVLVLASLNCPVYSQGIAEYGSLMGMPKNIPTSHSQKTLNRLYGGAANNMNNAASGAQSAGAGSATSVGGAGSSKSEKVGSILKQGQQAQLDLLEGRKLLKAKKYADAQVLIQRSLDVREKYWQGKDNQTPDIYRELAEACAMQGKVEEAEKALKGSIAAYARLHGPGSKHTAVPLKLLGDLYDKKGEHWKSHDSYLQSFMLTERYRGESSKDAMDLRLKMAKKSKDLEKYDKAADFYRKAIELDQDNDILSADEQLKVLNDYVVVLRKLKRNDEASKIEALLGSASGSASVSSAKDPSKQTASK